MWGIERQLPSFSSKIKYKMRFQGSALLKCKGSDLPSQIFEDLPEMW